MSKTILILIVVLVFIIGVVVFFDNVSFISKDSVSPSPILTIEPGIVSGNIRLLSPLPNDEISSPVILKGEARTFERAFAYRILDAEGDILAEDHSMSSGESDLGIFDPFEVEVKYEKPKTKVGSIMVFEYSAKDGEEINKVIIPVRFND